VTQEKLERLGWPGLVFGVALVLRLIGLGARPFWLDEVFTLQRATLPPAKLVLDSFQNHHMPSYFLLLRPLTQLENFQFWLRFPSAVFGAGAVALVYIIAERVGGRLSALLSALFLGLSPASLAYSQEARSYTLIMMLILVGLYGVVRLALDVPAAARPLREGAERRGWGLFILGTAGAVDVLPDSLLWLVSANLIFAVMIAQAADRRGLARNLLVADLIILALAAPLYALLELFQLKGFVATLAWVPPIDLARLWYSFGSVYFMHIADATSFRLLDRGYQVPLLVGVDVLLVAAVATAAWTLRRRPGVLAALGLSFLVLPVALTLFSLWQPVLVPRYIFWSAAPFSVLAGVGAAVALRRLRPWTRGLSVAGLAMVLMANLAAYYQAETKPRWDLAAQMLAAEVAPGDVIYVPDLYGPKLLKVYLPPAKRDVLKTSLATDLPHAQAAMAQGKRVWSVYGVAGQTSDPRPKKALYANIDALGTPVEVQAVGQKILIVLNAPNAQSSPCQVGQAGCS
jgi:4-amino-4-deoxy-L-arabinose transferase-like glycosyltransferase